MDYQYGIEMLGSLLETITGDLSDGINAYSDALTKLFIGPDTIFSGKVLILDANIFKTINLTEYNGWKTAFSSLSSWINATSDVASPRISYGNFYKRGDSFYI